MLIILQVSCKQRTLTPIAPAESMIFSILFCMAKYWSRMGSVVGRTMEFWINPIFTTLGALSCSGMARNLLIFINFIIIISFIQLKIYYLKLRMQEVKCVNYN